jgi:ABC-type Mn2+/Zn2+ transport system permease subunit
MDNIEIKTYLLTALAGAECGITGVFVFLLNIPIVGVAIAHAAMAGGIWGIVMGIEPKLAALIGAMVPAVAAGPAADRSRINPNITLAIIFSLAMALAYMGLARVPQGSALSYLWGSVFLAGAKDVAYTAAVLLVCALCITAYFRQISAVLFNREIAASAGINDTFIYYMMLFLTGAVVAVNLNIIGGLMLFSLIITPPAIAFQLTRDLKKFFIISAVIGAATGVCGAGLSFALNWPVSSSVVIFNTTIFIIVTMFFRGK